LSTKKKTAQANFSSAKKKHSSSALEWVYLGRAQTASALQRAESVRSSKSTFAWGGHSAYVRSAQSPYVLYFTIMYVIKKNTFGAPARKAQKTKDPLGD
jgi:hypothetical protein